MDNLGTMICKCGTQMKFEERDGNPVHVCPNCGAWCLVEWHKAERKPYPTSGIDYRDIWIFPIILVVVVIFYQLLT